MIRRLLVAVCAGVLAVTMLAAPAQAEQTSHTCKDWTGNITTTFYHLCITTWWHNQAGSTGITVIEIDVDLSGGPWEENAFTCDAIRMWNDKDVVKWRRDGTACDMTNSFAHKDWQPNFPDGLSMPDTNTVSISIAGWPRFDRNADPGRIVLTQNLHD